MEGNDAAALAVIDTAIQSWRQGDCTLGDHWFVHRSDLEVPLTEESRLAATEGIDTAETLVAGLMVATQTCDIVRATTQRPFVEVCPLVEVDDSVLREIERGRRPNYAYLPVLAERRLVADLDRVMTVEKSAMAKWDRQEGCRTAEDQRRLSQALARKRARAAFPDDFVQLAKRLVQRVSEKHDKESPEGRALRALREIRVRAEPSWDSKRVDLLFWLIRHEDQTTFEGRALASFLDSWIALVPPRGRFADIQMVVQSLEELSAKDYLESDPLDLDHLSGRESRV